MASKVEIINRGLMLLGANRIASLDELTQEAAAMDAAYEGVRDELLRSHRWNFAIERVQLAELSGTPVFGFAKYYALPSDCIMLLNTDDSTIPHKVEGTKIASDAPAVKIRYIKRITNEQAFDVHFTGVFAAALAIEVAPALTGGQNLLSVLHDLFSLKIREAKLSNAIENHHDVISDTTLTAAR